MINGEHCFDERAQVKVIYSEGQYDHISSFRHFHVSAYMVEKKVETFTGVLLELLALLMLSLIWYPLAS
jgi:hypothetical protein